MSDTFLGRNRIPCELTEDDLAFLKRADEAFRSGLTAVRHAALRDRRLEAFGVILLHRCGSDEQKAAKA